ncbi:hypothetical protein ACP70R_028351 [Stipagrostis hirtigluma subsp. patula]
MEQQAAASCAPPPAPVPLAWAVVPVDFTVVKKGAEMVMHDAAGSLAFRVAAAAAAGAGGGEGTVLLDAAGGVLVTVRSSSEGEWQAFNRNSLEQREIIFNAKVISASSSRKEVHVFIPPRSTFDDPKPNFRLIGSTFRRACTIIKGNSIVAQTNLLYKLKKAIYSRRKFRVTIYPGNDNVLIMAMIMAFYVEK